MHITKSSITAATITVFLIAVGAQSAMQNNGSDANIQIVSYEQTDKQELVFPRGIDDPPSESQMDAAPRRQKYRAYRVAMKNNGNKVVKLIDWRYTYLYDGPEGSSIETYRDFSSKIKIKPGESGKIEEKANETSITVERDGVSESLRPRKEAVDIRRVVYGDGSVWKVD